jgi:hypothetical protein
MKRGRAAADKAMEEWLQRPEAALEVGGTGHPCLEARHCCHS